MKTLVIYYSRTGATRGVAEELAHRLDAVLTEITSPRFRLNPFGYLRAGFDSVRGKLPPIVVPELDFALYDLVLVGAPIWTSYPALPVRSFFAEAGTLGRETALFFTCEGHSPVQAAVDEVRRLWPHTIKDAISINMKEESEVARANALLDFTVRLGVEPPAGTD
ncbi:MAG: flavodoxin [Rhodobiaceae bacterium]|nr:flavodoxin [Rhodobiaceae bacterium]